MINFSSAGTFTLGNRVVNRMGYGAMQLAGPGVFGPPKDRDAALAVLREAVASGVNHIDTSDFYGPHVTNQLIREALHPYPGDLTIVTKVGAVRGVESRAEPGRADAGGSRQSAQPRRRRARRRQPALDGRHPRAERGVDRGAVHRANRK
jgi:aryl-alcohol dehydrogenase-like predicted oxidoreductase